MSIKSTTESLKTIFIAIIIALLIRSFIFEPFNIPSGSMKPNLLVGDYLFVTKWSYGYSKHSLPFSLPIIKGRIFYNQPERGDIAVFKTPEDNRTDYIKRIIGLPGDEIIVINGIVFLNNVALPKIQIENFKEKNSLGQTIEIAQFKEILMKKNYNILDLLNNGIADNTNTFKVPSDYFFVMGDNRDNSQDSRFKNIGFIPKSNLVGKARIIFFSLENSRFFELWKWPKAIRYSRIFSKIK